MSETAFDRGTVRREVIIETDADAVWAWVGAPERLHQWFPGIVDCHVDGNLRTITTAGGLPMPETILTIDPILRRFQYRLMIPVCREHLSTIDVFSLDDNRSLVAYSVDAAPSVMALMIGGAAGNALENLKEIIEGRRSPAATPTREV